MKLTIWAAALLLCLVFLLPAASADTGASVSGGMGAFSISREIRLRAGVTSPENLGADEYISIYMDITNNTGKSRTYRDVYFRVDGGDKWGFSPFTLKAGESTYCHIYNVNMKKLSPGLHRVDFYIGNELARSQSFHLVRNWPALMPYPSASQKSAVSGQNRSPYIVFYPQFKGVDGVTEYAIDFWIDDMDKGTYFSTMDADLDVSSLTKKYASVTNDYNNPGGFYCGVQCWDNGKTGVIMSVWDNICRDKKGRETIICANQVYPEFRAGVSKTSGEGRFQQFLKEFPFQVRRAYRMLIQMSTSKSTGNTELTMWICDLAANQWTELVSWDLGYTSRFIKTYGLGGFMENYLVQYTGSVRNVSFSNIRGVNYKTGKWTAVKSVMFTVNNSLSAMAYQGSYNFGSDDSTFWIITSGVNNLCRLPKSGSTFSVKHASSSQPY